MSRARGQQSPPSSPAGDPPLVALRRVVAWALGLVLLVGTAGTLAVALFPTVTGGQALAVLSGSMTPGLPVGGMVFTRPVDPADVVVGDVLTFQRPGHPGELVTHRVVAVDRTGPEPLFSTQGDANPVADLDPVPASAVQGRLWFAVPELGRVTALLHSPKGLGVLVVLVCAVLAAAPGSAPARRPADGPDAGARPGGHPDADTDRLPPVADDAVRTAWLPAVPGRSLPPVPQPPRAEAVGARGAA